jgi:hypothetical protein
MHSPEGVGSLLASTKRGLGCRSRLGVDGLKWMLEEDVLDLPGCDVRFIQKRARLKGMTGAEWSLEL